MRIIKKKIVELRKQSLSDRHVFSKHNLVENLWTSVYNNIQASALYHAIRGDYKSKI